MRSGPTIPGQEHQQGAAHSDDEDIDMEICVVDEKEPEADMTGKIRPRTS